MPDGKYIDDPDLGTLSGTEKFPISNGTDDYHSTPNRIKTFVLTGSPFDDKQDKESELRTGGEISVGTYGGSGTDNDIRVLASTYYIVGFGGFSGVQTDFLDITLCSAGNARYIDIYGDSTGTIIKVEGTQGTTAVHPAQPADTALFGSVLVGDAGVSTTPVKVGAIALDPIPYSGQMHFYSDVFTRPLTDNFTVTGDTLRGNPFFLPTARVVKALSVRVSFGVASNGRLAIYADAGGKCGVKLWEGSNFSLGVSATIIATTGSLSLPAGKYWAVFNSSSSSTAQLRTDSTVTMPHILGVNMNASSPFAFNGISYASVFFASAFPSDLTATLPSGYTQGNTCPAIFVGF